MHTLGHGKLKLTLASYHKVMDRPRSGRNFFKISVFSMIFIDVIWTLQCTIRCLVNQIHAFWDFNLPRTLIEISIYLGRFLEFQFTRDAFWDFNLPRRFSEFQFTRTLFEISIYLGRFSEFQFTGRFLRFQFTRVPGKLKSRKASQVNWNLKSVPGKLKFRKASPVNWNLKKRPR